MPKMIGFDRKIQLDWLDATAGSCQQSPDPSSVAERLNQRLANEVKGSEARRKTITVLLRIWVNVPQEHMGLRDQALELATHVDPQERLWLHWGMCLMAYPFFRDVTALVGQLSRLQGTFSQGQIQRRMVESWGQRTTLKRATQRLLRTLIDWNVLQDTDTRGTYQVAPTHQTQNQALALWFLECALQANEAEQVPLSELGQLPYAFPFSLLTFINGLGRSKRFQVTRQGLDLDMVALA